MAELDKAARGTIACEEFYELMLEVVDLMSGDYEAKHKMPSAELTQRLTDIHSGWDGTQHVKIEFGQSCGGMMTTSPMTLARIADICVARIREIDPTFEMT